MVAGAINGIANGVSNALLPTAAGGNKEYIPSAAVARRLPSKWPRPVWHPPWKLFRVISGHLGCVHDDMQLSSIVAVLTACLLHCQHVTMLIALPRCCYSCLFLAWIAVFNLHCHQTINTCVHLDVMMSQLLIVHVVVCTVQLQGTQKHLQAARCLRL